MGVLHAFQLLAHGIASFNGLLLVVLVSVLELRLLFRRKCIMDVAETNDVIALDGQVLVCKKASVHALAELVVLLFLLALGEALDELLEHLVAGQRLQVVVGFTLQR